jgi:hypothetical protein
MACQAVTGNSAPATALRLEGLHPAHRHCSRSLSPRTGNDPTQQARGGSLGVGGRTKRTGRDIRLGRPRDCRRRGSSGRPGCRSLNGLPRPHHRWPQPLPSAGIHERGIPTARLLHQPPIRDTDPAKVVVLVDPVPEAHQLRALLLVLHPLDKRVSCRPRGRRSARASTAPPRSPHRAAVRTAR